MLSFSSGSMSGISKDERKKRWQSLFEQSKSDEQPEDQTKGKNDEEDAKKEKENDESQINVVRSRLKRLKFKQYLRDTNLEDEELIEEFKDKIEAPDGWEKEEHLDDLYPSIWLRREQFVIQVYARVGELAAQLGKLKDEDFKQLYGKESKEDGDQKLGAINRATDDFLEEDFVVIKQIMPPFWLDRWEINEDTGDEKENFDQAKEYLDEYIEDSIIYLDQLAKKEDIERSKKEKSKSVKPISEKPNSGKESDDRSLRGDAIPPYSQNAAPYDAYNN